MGQNKTKSRFGRPKENFISQPCVTENWSKHHCTTEPMSWRKCVNMHCEENTLWSWPTWQNCCWENKKISKSSRAPRRTKTIQENSQIKFKIFWSNRRVYVWQKVSERALIPCITPIIKHRGGSVLVYGVFYQ